MKRLLLVVAVVVANLGFADAIQVGRQLSLVQVNSVETEIIGTGFPSTRVLVNATFGNSCEVPNTEELASIVQHTRNFDVLNISLGFFSERACPAVYRPVTVQIDLGTYTKPNDGLFERIIVNGKIAK